MELYERLPCLDAHHTKQAELTNMKQTISRYILVVSLLISGTAVAADNKAIGHLLFELPFLGGNQRACATCHVDKDHFALLPEHVAVTPLSDPLFRRIDADDPSAAQPTYDHLRAGLVRITIPLAPNIDEIDTNGNVITNATRTIAVWRGVPTIENTAMTAPFQYDGRAPNYAVQAAGALSLHQQISYPVQPKLLDFIGDFEASVFSSYAVKLTAEKLAHGQHPADPALALVFPPNSDEAAGQIIFKQACALCHGGATGNTITSQAAHDETFFQTNPDGTAVFGPQGPVLLGTHQDDPFMNIGTSGFSYFTQPGTGPVFGVPPIITALTIIDSFPDHNTLSLPHYRFRFYTDATRTAKLVDLPPLPSQGLSPSILPQAYTTDPGRAVISGDPVDYEAFKVPQLRGLARTAPYFHDGSMKTLDDIVEFYSSRVLFFIPSAGFPPINPPLSPNGLPECFSPQQKRQLIAFLKQM